jgi:hypothetical protein
MSAATIGALTHLCGILARPYNVGFQTFSSETYLPDRSGCSSSEQRLCILQILGVKAFSEPAVNQSKELIRIPALSWFCHRRPRSVAERSTMRRACCACASSIVRRGWVSMTPSAAPGSRLCAHGSVPARKNHGGASLRVNHAINRKDTPICGCAVRQKVV